MFVVHSIASCIASACSTPDATFCTHSMYWAFVNFSCASANSASVHSNSMYGSTCNVEYVHRIRTIIFSFIWLMIPLYFLLFCKNEDDTGFCDFLRSKVSNSGWRVNQPIKWTCRSLESNLAFFFSLHYSPLVDDSIIQTLVFKYRVEPNLKSSISQIVEFFVARVYNYTVLSLTVRLLAQARARPDPSNLQARARP